MKDILKFRNREETIFYRVYYQNLEGRTIPELLAELRKKGDFTSPYHIIVSRDGDINEMRPLEAVAGSDLEYNELGIHVLVDAVDTNGMTRIQKLSLGDALDEIKKIYPHIERFSDD